MSSVRVGIDVGGTHTKAVAVDNETSEIIGKGSVLTTHSHPKGVAQGVVDAFQVCLTDNQIAPEDVIFIAHSTTQATNALLEGDVAKVGIIGMGGGGIGGFLSRRQTNIDNIDLGNNKVIEVESEYIKIKNLTESLVDDVAKDFKSKGCTVLVASKAFGVDNPTEENIVTKVAADNDMLSTSASEITKLYGLATRTKTAALNASILPTMLETANSTEGSVKEVGIEVPLMIMRGDGGVMEIGEMRKRPILTMLSGPAASVSGALMYLRASNAIFVEVGGTSTDISAIKDGKPAVDYSIIGGHRTYVKSLDVRVSGVAGGSMIRASENGSVTAVGPRSAHIADLGYAAFTETALFEGAEIYTVQPTESDPSDYIAIRLNNGESVAITTTCAANALGILEDTDFSMGNRDSSIAAMQLLAKYAGGSWEECAEQILDLASEIIMPVIDDLIEKYQLERDQVIIIGAGGGAGSLVRHTAKRMEIPFDIPENAEVISSIGVALAMVREMVERTIPNPTVEDLAAIKQEARDMAINSGAVEESIEVYTEIDEQSQKVTAVAMGSTEVRSSDVEDQLSDEEAIEIARGTIKDKTAEIDIEYTNGKVYYITAEVAGNTNVRIIDPQGFVKVQRRQGEGQLTNMENAPQVISKLWESQTNFASEIRITPDIFIIDGARIIDYSGFPDVEKVIGLLETEFDFSSDDEIFVVATYNGI